MLEKKNTLYVGVRHRWECTVYIYSNGMPDSQREISYVLIHLHLFLACNVSSEVVYRVLGTALLDRGSII